MFREMHYGMHQLGLSARENNSNLVKMCTCLKRLESTWTAIAALGLHFHALNRMTGLQKLALLSVKAFFF
jgi:hypothetical protein